jgi:hypothetical protein
MYNIQVNGCTKWRKILNEETGNEYNYRPYIEESWI